MVITHPNRKPARFWYESAEADTDTNYLRICKKYTFNFHQCYGFNLKYCYQGTGHHLRQMDQNLRNVKLLWECVVFVHRHKNSLIKPKIPGDL